MGLDYTGKDCWLSKGLSRTAGPVMPKECIKLGRFRVLHALKQCILSIKELEILLPYRVVGKIFDSCLIAGNFISSWLVYFPIY